MLVDKEGCSSDVIQAVAKELGIETALVKEIYENYWSNVRGVLAAPPSMNIKIQNIGKFHYPPKKIMKSISFCLNRLKRHREKTVVMSPYIKNQVEITFRDLWKLKQRFGYRITNDTTCYNKLRGYGKYTKKQV